MFNIIVVGLSNVSDDPASLAFYLKKQFFINTLFLSDETGKVINSKVFDINKKKIPHFFFSGLFFYIKELLRFKPEITEHYLHSGSCVKDFLFILISKIFSKKVNIICCGGEILYWKNHIFYKRFFDRLSYFLADAIVIKELYMQDFIKKYKIASIKKVFFIENGVSDLYKKKDIREKNDMKYILFYNSFKKWRNVDFLISCANEICKSEKKVFFLICGARNQKEYDNYFDLIENDRIILLYNNNNREFYYSLADIFCLPADIVWLNVSLLEAMSFGLPAIIPDVEGSSEIIENMENGIIFKHNDKEDFIEKIKILLNLHNEDLLKIQKSTRKIVKEKFGIKKRVKNMYALYKKMIELSDINV